MDPWSRYRQFQGTVTSAIQAAAKQLRVTPDDRGDFAHDLLVALIDSDVLSKADGSSSTPAFIRVAVRRLAIDWFRKRTGRWRASAAARRLGRPAVMFERLVIRDGWSRQEARQALSPAAGAFMPGRMVAYRRQVDLAHAELRHAADAVSDAVAPEETAESVHGVRHALAAAVLSLDLMDQAIIVLKFVDGMTMRDVGRALGVGAGCAQKRFQRARERLREQLQCHGVEPKDADVCIGLEGLDGVLEALYASVQPIVGGVRLPPIDERPKQSKAKQSKVNHQASLWCSFSTAVPHAEDRPLADLVQSGCCRMAKPPADSAGAGGTAVWRRRTDRIVTTTLPTTSRIPPAMASARPNTTH